MKVYLNEITGIADALVSMYMSKRTWTPNLDKEIRRDVDFALNIYKFDAELSYNWKQLNDRLNAFFRYAWKHTTMLDFITISVTVEGMHRAGQDDWDAHACRYANRIIRSSTRLADFGECEMSDYYKGKIIPTEMALDILEIELPDSIEFDGERYDRVSGGYVRMDLKGSRDAKRGLYRLCIPSSFIFKCNMAQWAHVYRMRNQRSNANPEVKELAEEIQDAIESKFPMCNRDFLQKVII